MYIVDATERLTTCEFSEELCYQTSPVASYSCGHCREELVFCTRDFRRHHLAPSTNLPTTDAAAIDQLVQVVEGRNGCAFLDFYCSDCGIPIRIYYEVDEYVGAKWQRYRYNIKFVVEGEGRA